MPIVCAENESTPAGMQNPGAFTWDVNQFDWDHLALAASHIGLAGNAGDLAGITRCRNSVPRRGVRGMKRAE